jgi:hypothetical protein
MPCIVDVFSAIMLSLCVPMRLRNGARGLGTGERRKLIMDA